MKQHFFELRVYKILSTDSLDSSKKDINTLDKLPPEAPKYTSKCFLFILSDLFLISKIAVRIAV